MTDKLEIGDVTLHKDGGGAVEVYTNGELVGYVKPAGLVDAARINDWMLSELGGLYYAAGDD